MIFTLFKTTFKRNWILLLIFSGVLLMYISVMLSMYDPNNSESMAKMLEMMPAEITAAFGMSNVATNLVGFLAGYLYGLLMLGFPLVYSIILANKLVAKQVDNGSFSYLLLTPNPRYKIIVTQCVYAVLSLIVLFFWVTAISLLLSEAMFPGLMDIKNFIRLNVVTCLVNIAVLMISFFSSCIFNESKKSLAFGAGVPIAFLLMQMLGGISADSAFLRKLSIYGLYNPDEIAKGADILGVSLIYIAISILLFVGSLIVFKRKNLPL